MKDCDVPFCVLLLFKQNIYFINKTNNKFMKKKIYEKPSVEVVVLNQESLLQTISGNDVTATMTHEWTEETIEP